MMVVLGERPSSSKRYTVLDLPGFPDVFTTRHITCVSCKEKIAITEGGKGSWFVRTNTPQTIDFHYEPKRERRPVIPISRQIQQPLSGRIARPRPSEFINCPRCGADNRNWVALRRKESNHSLFSPLILLWERYPKLKIALGISLLFSLIAFFLPLLFGISWLRAIVLAGVIPVFTLLLAGELGSKWNELRQERHLAQILPQTPRLEPKLWLRGFIWLIIAAVVVPVIFFSGLPTAYQSVVEFIEDPPEDGVMTTAEGVKVDVNEQLSETVENLENFGQEIGETVEDFPVGDLPELERQKERLSDQLENAADLAAEEVDIVREQKITQIDSELEVELDALKIVRNNEQKRFVDEIMADVRYFAVWGALVGLSLLITIMLVLPDVKRFALQIDVNLPPPVFYSVANMTRLVTWEARQSLEIAGDYFSHIQWTVVNRNEQGGLDLVGYFRDRPEIDIFGQPIGTMVRAQKHVIHTDKWCRIVSADIKDVTVPISIKGVHQPESEISPRNGSPSAAPPPANSLPTGVRTPDSSLPPAGQLSTEAVIVGSQSR